MRRVVITRVGVISPNAHSFFEFSDALRSGRSGIGVIDYFNPETFSTRIVGQVTGFDKHTLINRFPELARISDNKVFFGIHAFLEMLGDYSFTGKECAINLGTSLESFAIEKLFKLSPFKFDMDRYLDALAEHRAEPYLQLPLDYLGSFLKKNFGIGGANYVNCSACTASTQAIGHSFQMIRDGRYNMIVAGGFDSMLNPLGLGGFAALGALSDENDRGPEAIRPFDATRTGTILGEGAAVFLLEDLESALNNGAEILAEIKGYCSTLDAYKVSEPSSEGIIAAMEGALADAGIDGGAPDYISAHGTGTPLNDTIETDAIKKVFKERAYRIPVSSMKSMIGHLVGASGAVEVAGIIAMLKGDFIAPTINLEQRDPACDLDYVPKTSRCERISVALKNSMGFGGQNASLVIQRYIPKY